MGVVSLLLLFLVEIFSIYDWHWQVKTLMWVVSLLLLFLVEIIPDVCCTHQGQCLCKKITDIL